MPSARASRPVQPGGCLEEDRRSAGGPRERPEGQEAADATAGWTGVDPPRHQRHPPAYIVAPALPGGCDRHRLRARGDARASRDARVPPRHVPAGLRPRRHRPRPREARRSHHAGQRGRAGRAGRPRVHARAAGLDDVDDRHVQGDRPRDPELRPLRPPSVRPEERRARLRKQVLRSRFAAAGRHRRAGSRPPEVHLAGGPARRGGPRRQPRGCGPRRAARRPARRPARRCCARLPRAHGRLGSQKRLRGRPAGGARRGRRRRHGGRHRAPRRRTRAARVQRGRRPHRVRRHGRHARLPRPPRAQRRRRRHLRPPDARRQARRLPADEGRHGARQRMGAGSAGSRRPAAVGDGG